MKARNISLALLALGVCAAAAQAQGFWVKKDWQTWSKDECKRMLEDSPWAQKWIRGEVVEDRFGQPRQGDNRESEQQVFYTIQFRSALPVRQAFIRMMQLENKYDKMSANQKKQFDASVGNYLSRTYDDVIVVHVLYGSNIDMYAKEMKRIWQGYPADAPPHNITLITSSGVQVKPLKILSAPGGGMEFELIFPRNSGGEPVLTPAVKSVVVEFPHPDLAQMTIVRAAQPASSEKVTAATRVVGDFKVEKMMMGKEIVY